VEKKLLFLPFLDYFLAFLPIFSQLKTFPRNLSARIIIVLNATFLPNFTILGLLSAEISSG